MEPPICDRCGTVVEGSCIRHRRRVFCSDECCEAYEDQFMVCGEPDPADLLAPVDELEALAENDLEPLDPDADLDGLAEDE